ncbi:hypothetical protein PENANT_c008G02038 [Penicillium antarcticum]|uniref:Major facilitator superfamily (MFS) profile domain-containing protein n=1 Tax=Penicillium antarcticum TaxID=416450 RepID=A0A1V6QAH3_9EURO|nr:hypothetical protein PENANT_c008G02038 [Penicillium antarcticum]
MEALPASTQEKSQKQDKQQSIRLDNSGQRHQHGDAPTPHMEGLLPHKKSPWQFWAVFPALCMTTFLSALDTSILSTALPTIALDINAGESYMWITNSYILSSTVVLPLFGQTSNIFGRRWVLILSVVIFAVGSGLAGGADNTVQIIAGRTIQGIGGGGINTLVDTVICDLVPLRQRGKYVALMAAVWAVGTVVGPVLGGAFAEYTSWRWIFYINLPLSAVSLILLLLFLRVSHPRAGVTIWQQLRRVDYIGNAILAATVVAVLLALSWAGIDYPWSSWRVLSRFCQEPSIPTKLFSSGTAAIRSSTATESGLFVLPITAAIAPFGIITGVLIASTGKYRAYHFLGYICLTAAIGLFSLLNEHSPAGHWAGFQVLFGAGSGMIFSSTLPPIQASLPDSDMATATATWAFMRSFGCIWGIAIPTTVFNARVQKLLYRVSDVSMREKLANGGA